MNRTPGTDNRSSRMVYQPGRGPLGIAFRRFLGNKLASVGALLVLLLGLTALAAPVLAVKDPAKQDYDTILASPSMDHPLGTDRLGRDTLSRLVYGGRTSLAVGILTQFVVLAIAIPVGISTGFAGTRIDEVLMRGVDIVYAFPDILLIILLRAIFGGNLFMMTLAIGLASWPTIARLIRGQILSLKEREYILAARAIGSQGGRIMIRHLLPNALGPVIVAVTFLVPKAIFAEAALSYIGIGVAPETPSWGTMVNEGYSVILVTHTPVLFPIIAIALVVLAFTFIGDGLRDAMDPRFD